MSLTKTARGFTLVELLVVIAIIAILALVVTLVINPVEWTKQGRDSGRLTDMASLQQAITLALQEATSSASQVLCNGGSTPCNGSSHTGSRASDGSGWVKVNLSTQKNASLPTLPIDPTNTATYHYTYCSDGNTWEIDTVLESTKYADKMTTDGGNEIDKYEVGSTLGLIAASGGSCVY